MSISRLPKELITEILRHVDFQDQARKSRVCRLWNLAARSLNLTYGLFYALRHIPLPPRVAEAATTVTHCSKVLAVSRRFLIFGKTDNLSFCVYDRTKGEALPEARLPSQIVAATFQSETEFIITTSSTVSWWKIAQNVIECISQMEIFTALQNNQPGPRIAAAQKITLFKDALYVSVFESFGGAGEMDYSLKIMGHEPPQYRISFIDQESIFMGLLHRETFCNLSIEACNATHLFGITYILGKMSKVRCLTPDYKAAWTFPVDRPNIVFANDQVVIVTQRFGEKIVFLILNATTGKLVSQIIQEPVSTTRQDYWIQQNLIFIVASNSLRIWHFNGTLFQTIPLDSLIQQPGTLLHVDLDGRELHLFFQLPSNQLDLVRLNLKTATA